MKDLDKKILENETKLIISSLYWIKGFSNIEILWNNENIVLKIQNTVFRITKFLHRSEKEIKEETKLLDILHKNKADVVEIIKSSNNHYFEIDTKNKLYIVAFTFAKWKIIDVLSHKNRNSIIELWGKSMGKIHKITSKNYEKLNYNNRLDWSEEIIIKNAKNLLPTNDTDILNILEALKYTVGHLEKTNENYWFVHTDMRPRNFHYENWNIIHFDFDDISGNWFIYDIAVSLLHELEELQKIEERNEYALLFLENFLIWYKQEKELTQKDGEKFIDFMKIRLIYAYIDYYKRLKIKNIDSWKWKMKIRRNFILNFETFLDTKQITNFIFNNI